MTVPKHKFDTLVEHCKRLDTDLAQARARVNEVELYQHNDVWFWQHDGQDFLKSLTCPVVIQPHHLRELLEGNKPTGNAKQLAGLALDLHLGDDSPDPISKRAFASVVALVESVQKPTVVEGDPAGSFDRHMQYMRENIELKKAIEDLLSQLTRPPGDNGYHLIDTTEARRLLGFAFPRMEATVRQ